MCRCCCSIACRRGCPWGTRWVRRNTCRASGWTLLVSDGECVARYREVLRDALDPTHPIDDWFVRAGAPEPSGQAVPAWSYRMSRVYYEGWRDRVIRSARGDPAQVPHLVLGALYREPGSRGPITGWARLCPVPAGMAASAWWAGAISRTVPAPVCATPAVPDGGAPGLRVAAKSFVPS